MAQLKTVNDALYIDDHKVLRGWESYNGWYWFGVEQDAEDQQLWFGYVQGHEDEWGYFSQDELESMGLMVWEIQPVDLPHAGRRAA